LPAPGLQSFGLTNPDGSRAATPPIPPRATRSVIARAEVPLPPLPPWPRHVDTAEVTADPDLPAPSADTFAVNGPKVAEAALFPVALRPSVDPLVTGSVARPRPAAKRAKAATATAASPKSLRAIFSSQTPPKPPAAIRARPRTPESKPVTTSSLRAD
jgi:hypothetical protein